MTLYIIPQHVFPSRLFATSLKSIKQEKSIPLVVNELKKINNMEFWLRKMSCNHVRAPFRISLWTGFNLCVQVQQKYANEFNDSHHWIISQFNIICRVGHKRGSDLLAGISSEVKSWKEMFGRNVQVNKIFSSQGREAAPRQTYVVTV